MYVSGNNASQFHHAVVWQWGMRWLHKNIALEQDKASNVKTYIEWNSATVQTERKICVKKIMKPCGRCNKEFPRLVLGHNSHDCFAIFQVP